MAPSDPSSSEEQSPRSKRPISLILALLIAWFLGLRTAHDGYTSVTLILDPLVGDTLGIPRGVAEAMVNSLGEASQTALPIGIAQTMVGAILVVLCAASLFGGTISRSFGLQVLLANALVAIASYALGAPVRDALIQALLEAPEFHAMAEEAQVEPAALRGAYGSFFLVGLGLQLGALAFAAWAWTRSGAAHWITPGTKAEG